MAVDITLLFKASVKTVKTRNKALGVAAGDTARDELLKRSAARSKSDFTSRAREVVSAAVSAQAPGAGREAAWPAGGLRWTVPRRRLRLSAAAGSPPPSPPLGAFPGGPGRAGRPRNRPQTTRGQLFPTRVWAGRAGAQPESRDPGG